MHHTEFTEAPSLVICIRENIIRGRSSRNIFQQTIEQVQRRMNGLKQQCLSLADKITWCK